MQNIKANLLTEIANYYSAKLIQHGETPEGVDWNSSISQTLRFEQLVKIISTAGKFSITDLGCGYGALFDFLTNKFQAFSYLGVDISEDMIQAATQRYKAATHARFITAALPDNSSDYGIASGVFNVRLDLSDAEWHNYILTTLDMLNHTSELGFAFNCLTSYSDEEKKRGYLYYTDPCFMFDLCKRRYSKQVALLHDYGLYEFTILVRKI